MNTNVQNAPQKQSVEYLKPVSWGYSVLSSHLEQYLINYFEEKGIKGFRGFTMHVETKKVDGELIPIVTSYVYFNTNSPDISKTNIMDDPIMMNIDEHGMNPSDNLKKSLAAFTADHKLRIIRNPDGLTYDVPVSIFKILGMMTDADFVTTEIIVMGINTVDEGIYNITFEKQLKNRGKDKKVNTLYLKTKKHARYR